MRPAVAALVTALALVLAACHEPVERAPVSDADRTAVRAAVTEVLEALAAGSPERYCATLTRASRERLAQRDGAGGSCERYARAKREALLDSDVRRLDIRRTVADLEIIVEGRFAVARTPDNEFPLRREGAAWKLDLLSIRR